MTQDSSCGDQSDVPKVGAVYCSYTLVELIANTRNSYVFRAASPQHGDVAIKFINTSQIDVARINNEINILRQCHCEQINTLIDSFDIQPYKCIVMPYADGGDLKHFLEKHSGSLCEDDIRKIVFDAIKAIQYLHSHNIWHRDVKIENFLITHSHNSGSPTVLLSDFGLSKKVNPGETVSDFPGTYQCAAPEVITHGSYNSSIDMWGIGVLIYHLIGGTNPFPNFPESTMRRCILRGAYFFPDHSFRKVSKEAKSLIDHLIQVDPMKRFTAEEALESSWFSSLRS